MTGWRAVGLDLAWGARGTTGAAVLEHDGRLLHLAALRECERVVSRRFAPQGSAAPRALADVVAVPVSVRARRSAGGAHDQARR